jgi:hypothetical protein
MSVRDVTVWVAKDLKIVLSLLMRVHPSVLEDIIEVVKDWGYVGRRLP